MTFTEGGVTAAKGFKAADAAAGIKYQGRPDMAMILSSVMCKAAGTFTTNVVKAAPVIWDRDIVKGSGLAQAVVINSGIANACTGEEGMKYCRETASAVFEKLAVPENAVLVASTGVIGMQLRIDRIRDGISMMSGSLSDTIEAGHKAARAIMTTDTKPKEAAVSFRAGGKDIVLGGMCKGSGMIHPNMCTMLCFLTTDINISQELLQEALSCSIQDTFNMVSVDGDTSTNDTVLLLANGLARNPEITEKNDDYYSFCEALKEVNTKLCRMIAGDGEGATALFEVEIKGADTKEQAKVLARSVVSSNLVKAAICGHDANWGRILCAMGYSGAEFDPDRTDLYFESAAGKIQIMSAGTGCCFSEEEATRILSEPEVKAIAVIGKGPESAVAWGCDLTHGYIDINADYRS
ncbi:MAG: bifunctional glutamate N-acetyltransferase/amino-acid acetyltransferase ArgJ [Lachnospiraceae bacterium]|nr:bifunctional glutamate N-acetyltransferase/amino-acid acetyltransferase ArgJ [Lachnospiraceae bacterium]